MLQDEGLEYNLPALSLLHACGVVFPRLDYQTLNLILLVPKFSHPSSQSVNVFEKGIQSAQLVLPIAAGSVVKRRESLRFGACLRINYLQIILRRLNVPSDLFWGGQNLVVNIFRYNLDECSLKLPHYFGSACRFCYFRKAIQLIGPGVCTSSGRYWNLKFALCMRWSLQLTALSSHFLKLEVGDRLATQVVGSC